MNIYINKNMLRKSAVISIMLLLILSGASYGATVHMYLKSEVTNKIMPDSTNITMWGFASCNSTFTACTSASVPGPLITATEGDTLIIHLKNSLNLASAYLEPVSVIIPGQKTALNPVKFSDADGRLRVQSFTDETPADNSTVVTYTWTGVKAGTYLYQSGTHPALQIQMGLYGPFQVYPATPGRAYNDPSTAFDIEKAVLLSEIDPALHTAVANNTYGISMTSTIDYNPRYFLINGEPYSVAMPLLFTGNIGDRVLLRFLNAGLETHVPVMHGLYMKLIAEDGNLKAYPKEQYTVMLPAGKTQDAIITLPSVPDIIPLYDRMLNLTNWTSSPGGLLTYIKVANPVQHLLTVDKTGSTGTGKIIAASMPGGIDCGSDCNELYNSGSIVTLSAIPDAGSYFNGWSGGGCSGTGDCVVTMDSPKTVTGVFKTAVYYNVTPSAGPNGTISPSTVQSIIANSSTSFMLYPSAHYHVAPVTGTCGGTLAGNEFSTAPVTADCSVIANFAIDQYTITPSAGPNGGITPPGPQTVDYNSTMPFSINAATGYHIVSVTGCGGTLDTNTNVYTTGPITANCTVTASFAINQYNVTPSAGPNGSISPSTQQTVNYNNTAVFTVNPNAGFGIASVTGCGGTLNVNTNQYTTGPITADCTVNATFVAIPPVTVVTPNGGQNWTAGSTYTIRWTYTGNPGSYVKIELWKGGLLNRTISSFVFIGSGGNGSYNWNIPSNQTPDVDYRIKVTSTTNAAATDESDVNFTILGPTITVSTPNGGENWTAGSTYAIRWTYTGNPGSYVKIELWKGGLLNRTISSFVFIGSGGNGSYNWNIPSNQTPDVDYRIKVTSTTNAAAADESDVNFTILGPTITVTVPNGSESWRRNTGNYIRWTYTGNPGNVRIELLNDPTGTVNRIISSSALVGNGGNGSYYWFIPYNQTLGSFKIRVTSTANGGVTDTSNNIFTINP